MATVTPNLSLPLDFGPGIVELRQRLADALTIIDSAIAGESGAPAWADITGKPAVIAAGADAATARTAIGLGTLAVLSAITSGQITDGTIVDADINAAAAIALTKLANVAAGTGGLAAGTVQATFQALATRIAALEAA